MPSFVSFSSPPASAVGVGRAQNVEEGERSFRLARVRREEISPQSVQQSINYGQDIPDQEIADEDTLDADTRFALELMRQEEEVSSPPFFAGNSI